MGKRLNNNGLPDMSEVRLKSHYYLVDSSAEKGVVIGTKELPLSLTLN